MEDLNQYLAGHHGVITRGRARLLGLSDDQIRRRLRTGEFLRVGPSVFRIASAPDTWDSRARAAALSARGLVSHTSALRVWEVDGFDRHQDLHVVVGADRQPRSSGATVHRRILGPNDGQLVNAIPVTEPTRSVLDAAALLTVSQLDAVVDSVIRKRLTTLDQLVCLVAGVGTAGRAGMGTLRRLLEERDPGARVPDSTFNRLVGSLLVATGLPAPQYEFEVWHESRLVGRADLAYPQQRLLIECDGARWHHNRRSFAADPRRRNALVLAGYQVLNFTWDDYANRRNQIARSVAAALAEDGQGLCAQVS